MCRKCFADGIIRKADVVDHIIPLKVDWNRRLDPTNWQPLCHTCHNIKTRAENS
ncbi:HNH endonuclease [Holzapfeliella sp. JNUCC 72]